MKYLLTTYNTDILKEFLRMPLNRAAIDGATVYVDKDDDKELQDFEEILKDYNVIIVTRKDFKKFYGDNFHQQFTTLTKNYFINYIIRNHPEQLENGFYFTDDDITIFAPFEFGDDEFIFQTENFYNLEKYYGAKHKWIVDFIGDRTVRKAISDTQCWIGKDHIPKLTEVFSKEFEAILELMKDKTEFLNLKPSATNKRKCRVEHFNFNLVIFNLMHWYFQDVVKYQNAILFGFGKGEVEGHRKANTIKFFIDKHMAKEKSYPPYKQPLFHFNLTQKMEYFRMFNDCMLFDKEMNSLDYFPTAKELF